ncbi:Capping protein Arp2/3 and myosin-I linker protein 3, partial [Dissostichus eleginoides]
TEVTFNFLEIRAMNTYPEHQVVIDTDKTTYSLKLQNQEQLNHVVSHINYSLSRVFNNSIYAPPICRAEGDVTDGSIKFSANSESSLDPQKTCGGFSETYAALCDYNGIGCKEEVQWDVDTIYHSQDNREFNLVDFSHLDSRDLAVIVASIAYNTWFTKLHCKDMRIGSEVVDQVLHTVSKSNTLEELTLENAGLKSSSHLPSTPQLFPPPLLTPALPTSPPHPLDFPQKMASALSENPASVIHSLNLAHNTLDNQGVSNLIQQVCRLNKGLRLLNLSKTSLSSKGVVTLSQALCSSDDYSNSLLHLDLSKNPGVLSGEDATNLYMFLAQPNCLVHLDLSGTDCTVDSLFGALLRGCCADLSYLNLSKNSFSHSFCALSIVLTLCLCCLNIFLLFFLSFLFPRKARDSLPTFRQFFSSAFSLTHVSLASVKVPPDMLRALFLGLSNNPHITDLHLDISSCELRSAGAGVIQELFPRVACVGTLDISDNGLDADLLAVIPAFSRHPSLKHLMLGKNFNIKGRVLEEILQKLVHLVQEEECALHSLSLADSRLRQRGTVMVNALGSNACLRKVDLSGNLLEDSGAKMLSKALQINTTLRSVTWDRNNTTAMGFQDVARALEHNFTLQYMPLPLSDVTQAHRSNPEKTDQALTKCLPIRISNVVDHGGSRNNQTQHFSQKQALRLHQGLVTSTAEQQVGVLKGSEEGEEVQTARQILKEARDSRALYPSLCELAHVLSVDGPVKQRLDTLAGELAKAADKELQVVVDSMVSLCRELCPMSCSAAERLNPPLSSISEQVSIPRSAIRSALMERAAEDINRALEEVKLSVVSYLTNSIVDQILQELYTTHKILLRQVSQAKRWDDVGTGRRTVRQSRIVESLEFPDEDFGVNLGIDTMAIKKRSSRTRRIRPVSTRPSVGDEPSPSPTPSAPPHSDPLTHSASWECLSTLPTNGSPLRHVTHVRPRPPRRHRAGHPPPESHGSENGGASTMEDGLPDFYSKRVLPDSQLSSLHQGQSLRRKKRRSMLSIFSGFRKNRNSTISNQDPDPSENVYSMIQHPKDAGRPDSAVPGANGTMSSPRPMQGVPSTDLVSMVYSCIGAEIEDSDGSSSCDIKDTEQDTDRSTIVSDVPPDAHTNGHVASSREQPARQAEGVRQERIVPLTDPRSDVEEDREGSQARPEPPPQSCKPSVAVMRQRHLQESLEEAGRLQVEEDQSERKHEEKQRGRGPEGQRPLLPTKLSLDILRDTSSPEKAVRSPKSSPISPGEELTNEQRSLPPAQPIIEEDGTSPPASANPGREAVDPASQDEDEGRNGFPAASRHTRKSNSFDIGMDPDSPYDLERSSDRRFPVKKPSFPQYRNSSLDFPAGTRCMYLFHFLNVRYDGHVACDLAHF